MLRLCLAPCVFVLVLGATAQPTAAQLEGQDTWVPTYGNRPIDKLPKSHYAQPEEELRYDRRHWPREGFDEVREIAKPEEHELAVYPKDLFRTGEADIERLCVIEARRPEGAVAGGHYALQLFERIGSVLQSREVRQNLLADADWIGPNYRMRSYWLPVGGGEQVLDLGGPSWAGGAMQAAGLRVDLTEGAPWALIEAVEPEWLNPVDAGIALLPGSHTLGLRGNEVQVRVGVRAGHPAGEHVRVAVSLERESEEPRVLARERLDAEGRAAVAEMAVAGDELPRGQCVLLAQVQCGEEVVAEERLTVHMLEERPRPAEFGAHAADLRYALPVDCGEEARSWDDLWAGSDKRDVVVSFRDSDARFVFWRGASYVGCWALPEAWLTYEWLEAEPDFYGAVDCVEPIMDKDCRYSEVEIVSSTPARVVVKWEYALTDLEVKVIRDEHAEEVFTFYPDGTGTRYLRGFYRSGWHETQEFIVINRPGRWPSHGIDPQAITFLSLNGARQAPAWPQPGFTVDGWPQVIAIVNVGNGPRPFMATADEPYQLKVWADPYLDKPDLFNSYPHWPVTRGMRTAWLADPADFARPTHTNLATLVSDPVRSTEEEKDFLWLIGVAKTTDDAVSAARSWLHPGSIEPKAGLRSAVYSQVERAYVLTPESEGTREITFDLVPEDGSPITNPAFIVKGWEGPVRTTCGANAREARWGREEGQVVVSVDGRFDGRTAFGFGEE